MPEDGRQCIANRHAVYHDVCNSAIGRICHIISVTVIELEGHLLGIGL